MGSLLYGDVSLMYEKKMVENGHVVSEKSELIFICKRPWAKVKKNPLFSHFPT